ncbi:beta-glucuronosyltransferase GlcAT14A [Ricinus communis]|uniref:beta-glucuronosyltransferase GlcAT14A n=1 Tax=Ricinus communis TaxID=3988 RepID=UPI00201A483C|nr:beta-glucuronosyltransferase GlcAT14A [Ricinus communis]
MMRTSKISLGNSDHRLWILAFPMSLMLLIAVARPWLLDHHDEFSAPMEDIRVSPTVPVPSKGHGFPPILAYWICGTSGDSNRMLRLLKSIYHPRNQYLLQLDAESSASERAELVVSIQSEALFRAFGNVNVVGRSYAINKLGSSALSATLHAAALLLKLNKDWDWFINLSPADYPLMRQDDFLHAMTSLPKDLNFIHYSKDTEWKQKYKVNQIVMDPSLYLQKSSDLFYAVETRPNPDAFKIFGGSPWVILTRSLMEYCVQGWENLPRKLLMYFNNMVYPIEFYFHTVICNSPEFRNTTVNANLIRYNILENHSSNGEPSESFYDKMLASGAAFARPFRRDDSVLINKVDETVLNRQPNVVVPGNWCTGGSTNSNYTEAAESSNLCSTWGNLDAVKPGSCGIKLASLFSMLQIHGGLRTGNHCLQ